MAASMEAWQAEVERDVSRLAPRGGVTEFPPTTQAPELAVPESFVWSQIYERRDAHVLGTRDSFEREAAERLWKGWNDWHRDRLDEWPALLAGATWPAEDLAFWADWWKRLTPREQEPWDGPLKRDPGWWRELAEGEREWWRARNVEQEQWLLGVMLAAHEKRRKTLFGMQAPDDAWQEAIDGEGERRLHALEGVWQQHAAALKESVRRGALKQEWYRKVRADEERQLAELKALSGSPADYERWRVRVQGQGEEIAYGEWQQFQAYWAQCGEQRARQALAPAAVRGEVCKALVSARRDALAMGRALTPVLVGLATTRALPVALTPVVVAAMAAMAARDGVEAVCGG